MLTAVTIPELLTTFFVEDLDRGALPEVEGRDHWKVDANVRVEVPPDLYDWSEEDEPEPILLCRSCMDPGFYRVFKRSVDAAGPEFDRTGMTFGRIWTQLHWERFALNLPHLVRAYRLTESELPDLSEAPVFSGREAS